MRLGAVFLIGLALGLVADGKILAKQEIVKQLVNNRFDRTFISQWLCLIENESGGDTKKVQTNNGKVSYQYGLFQIDSAKGCGAGYSGGLCNINCNDLLTDSIDKKNADCAKKYFERYGFKAWPKWMSNCKLKPLPNPFSK